MNLEVIPQVENSSLDAFENSFGSFEKPRSFWPTIFLTAGKLFLSLPLVLLPGLQVIAAVPNDATLDGCAGGFGSTPVEEHLEAGHIEGFPGLVWEESAELIQGIRVKRLGPLRTPSQPAAVIVMLHGIGAPSSHGQSMRFALELLSADVVTDSASKTRETMRTQVLRDLKKEPHHPQITQLPEFYVEAFDFPVSPKNFSPERISAFSTLEKSGQWLKDYLINNVAERFPDRPIFLYSKSSSAVIAVEAARILQAEKPGLVKGLILTSPVVPGDTEMLARNKANLEEVDKKANVQTIPEIMDWSWRIHEGQSWFIKNPFMGLPTFIATGGIDTEVLGEERKVLEQISKTVPNVQYVDYPMLGHDLALRNRKFAEGRISFGRAVFKFIMDNL